jgi:hypothetical protein
MTKNVAFSVGEVIKPAFCAASTVVGIDHYTMKAFDGQFRAWDSYTLTSGDTGLYARWWIVNVAGRGAYAYTAAPSIPDDVTFLNQLSGLVTLNSEGNADLSSETGALATYEAADGTTLYAEEVFTGAPRLLFVGVPFTP